MEFKNKKILAAAVIIASFLAIAPILLPTSAKAIDCPEGKYCMLAPLPGIDQSLDQKNILGTYIPYLFNLLIGLSAVTAVVMIVIGGFQYMTTDAFQGKQDGKNRIKNAVIGLVLVIAAYLILYTINPNLLNINLNIGPATTAAPKLGSLTVNGTLINLDTKDQLLSQDQASLVLKSDGFSFDSTGNCYDPTNGNCTSVQGMHSDTAYGLVNLKDACGSSCAELVITGGTEVGHACNDPATCLSHQSGFKADISNTQGNGANLVSFIEQQVQAQNNTTMQTNGFYNITINGYTYQVHPEGSHMDITVIPKQTPTQTNQTP